MAARTTEAGESASTSGSWPLSDIAEVKMRGGDIPKPGSAEEERILAAWEVYRYIRAQAQRAGKEILFEGRDGWEVSIEMPDVFTSIWPAGESPLPIAEVPHIEARGAIVNWLCTQRDLAVRSRGNPAIANKKTSIPARPSSWWVSASFRGAPTGMKLPDVSEITGEKLPLPPEPERSPSGEVRDWWCPYTSMCQADSPFTERGLTSHLSRVHTFKPGGALFDIAMQEAADLRGTPREPEPENEVELLPLPPVSIAPIAPPHQGMRAPVFAPPNPVPALVPVGTVSAQARVFLGEVARLEDENAALRREVGELRRQLEDLRDQPVRMSATDRDDLARAIAKLVRSEGEWS